MLLDEFRSLLLRHTRAGTSTPDGVHVSRVDLPGPPTASTTGTILAVVAQGTKRLALGDRVFDYGAGQYLVASLDLPVTGQYTEATPERPALGFGLELKPSLVAELLLHPSARDLARPARGTTTPLGVAVSDTPPALLDAVVRMLRLLDRPRDLAVLGPGVEREILWLLLNGEQGAAVRQLGLADSSLTHVGHAVRWLREHYAEPIRVDDLADLARMSPSAFHRSFRADR